MRSGLRLMVGCAFAVGGWACVGTSQAPVRPALEVVPPDVVALHQPMHPADGVPVTFKATAVAKKITLRSERLALAINSDGTMSQSVVEPLATLKKCDGCGTPPLTCEHRPSGGSPAASLIRFEAVAEAQNGAIGS